MTILFLILLASFVFLLTIFVFFFWLNSVAPTHPLMMLLNGISGLMKSTEHTGVPTILPEFTKEERYPATTPPPNTANKHGEMETLDDGTQAIHWYAEAAGVTFHFVTAGDPAAEPMLMLHGLPESWWSWRHQIADFATEYYVIAMDNKGYGQSDKRLTLDYTNATMAREVSAFLDKLGVDRFTLIAADRGAVIADHMTSVPFIKDRIIRYVRMQQSFNEPHGQPAPPHAVFKSKLGEGLFQCKNFIPLAYNAMMGSDLNRSTIKRLDYEFKFKGVAQAVRKYFGTTNLDFELKERHDFLFNAMTMPILILQGRYDLGQHAEEYARAPDFAPQVIVRFVDAAHFAHQENPVAINRAISDFFASVPAGWPNPGGSGPEMNLR